MTAQVLFSMFFSEKDPHHNVAEEQLDVCLNVKQQK